MHSAPESRTINSERERAKELLVRLGFEPSEALVDRAIAKKVREVASIRLKACPDCNSRAESTLGNFVYYWHMVSVKRCKGCDLIYTDIRLDCSVITKHFEVAYKDEQYFVEKRRAIFDHLAVQVARVAPKSASVLDIGGASGHLMSTLRVQRPDLAITVNDLSASAVASAARDFGFETIHGGIEDIVATGRMFDVIVLSDVLYYEPKIVDCWNALDSLLSVQGNIVMRLPNKLHLIRAGLLVDRLTSRLRPAPMEPRVRFLNPEHLFVFSKKYLESRFRSRGFGHPQFLPSPLLAGRGEVLGGIWYATAKLIHAITGGGLVVTPGQVVVVGRATQRK